MATYLITREITITRQEGNPSDVIINVPESLSLSGKTAHFRVVDSAGKIIIDKEDEIVIDGQTLTVLLVASDTARKSGKFRWQLDVSDANGPITIGKGDFVINKSIIV